MGERRYIGLDIETYDPYLQKRGWSWKYGEGYILCTALYEMSTGRSVVVAGLHNDNSPYSKERRFRLNNQIEQLLRDENVTLIGANIQYDLGWLLSEYAMDTFDVKCKFIDVLQAEAILNEHVSHSLEEVSNKYLGYGKVKARIEEWIKENIPNCKGDFRKYLKEAPYDLLEEYVTGDAANTCLVWKKQLTHLKKQELTERVKLEFNCILPALQMTINGFPFDNEQRKINCEYLTKIEETFAKQFQEKYNLPKFNVGSTKQVAAFLDAQGVPYKCKITLKGKNGQKYTTSEEKDRGYYEVKKMIQGFRLVKGEPIAYVSNKLAQRTCDILTEEGYIFNCSPNIDKNYYATMRESNETVAILADWKVCKGIISKLLSDEYERFIGTDGKLHPQFNITDTKTFRFSSQKMNCQQVPSKGGVTLNDGTFISFPALTRSLFKPEKGCVYVKIDYGQIEYRLICNIAVGKSGEEVRRAFQENPDLDFHQYTVDLTGLTRKLAKNLSFGVSFGMSIPSMAENFGWTLEHAQELYDQYMQHLPFVLPTLTLVGDIAKERGYIKTALGSHARLLSPNKAYTMLNRYTQGSGAEIMKASMVELYETGLMQEMPFHATIHDELGFSIKPTVEQVVHAYEVKDVMCNTVKLRVPLVADLEFGDDWYNVHSVQEWLDLAKEGSEEWAKSSQELKQVVLMARKFENIKEDKNECIGD